MRYLLSLMVVFFFDFSSHAKRLGPKPVKPVLNAGLRYEVVVWAFENKKMKQNGGYVRVLNARNDLPICTKQVYETKYDKMLESDIQDNFITGLKIEGHNLVVSSEKLAPLQMSIENFCDEVKPDPIKSF